MNFKLSLSMIKMKPADLISLILSKIIFYLPIQGIYFNPIHLYVPIFFNTYVEIFM